MEIDHIYIFTDDGGKVADELVSFGLTEGNSRVHQGQGTTNRTFSFDNFFLEILWVHNEEEIKSDSVRPTGLWQRANFRKNNYSPFGLCVANSEETDLLFEHAFKYQPDYFPAGMALDILSNDHQPGLPFTFRLPFKRQKTKEFKPLAHGNGLHALTKATFLYKDPIDPVFHGYFDGEQSIQFIRSDKTWLNLLFDHKQQGLSRIFETLRLTIDY